MINCNLTDDLAAHVFILLKNIYNYYKSFYKILKNLPEFIAYVNFNQNSISNHSIH